MLLATTFVQCGWVTVASLQLLTQGTAAAVVVAAAAAGVRNYVARNHLRAMRLGDRAFFYHSSCKVPGIVGIVEVREMSDEGCGAHECQTQQAAWKTGGARYEAAPISPRSLALCPPFSIAHSLMHPIDPLHLLSQNLVCPFFMFSNRAWSSSWAGVFPHALRPLHYALFLCCAYPVPQVVREAYPNPTAQDKPR